MNNNILMLIRREIWEHRSLWIAPLTVAGVILIVALLGGVHVGNGDDFWFGYHDEGMSPDQRAHLVKQMSPPDDVRKGIIAGVFSMLTIVQLVVLGIVVFFYLLDTLLAERRDRSILFWKSLPISDGEVVASKALTALVVAPLFVLAVGAVTQVLFAGIAAIRLGDLPFIPWDTVTWLKVQVVLLGFVPMVVLWYLPLAGYFLVVSVWARKNAFLWAVLPWIAILIIEGLIMRSHHFADFLGDRFGGFADIMRFQGPRDFQAENVVGVSYEYLGRVFADWEIWAGVVVGLALIYAATRIRRMRDDS
jgi:ABC-2 type transport system permease protein